MEAIQIRMLGEFSLSYGGHTISDAEKRSKKVWSLLAYLIYNRDRSIPHQKLVDLLWGEDSSSSNPENAMRITMHRARGMLDELYEGAGRELIVRRDNGYGWNNEAAVEIDCDRFVRLTQPIEDEEQHLQNLLDALKLYKGAFLPRQSSEMWAIPVGTHFQARFLEATLEAAGLLSSRERHAEAADICRNAIASEPYHEPLYQKLMQSLAVSGDIKGASDVFEQLSKRLEDDFGIEPSEETRTIYRDSIASSKKARMLPVEEVLEDLHEPEEMSGAMQCDYDHFKVLCYAESRSMERNGTITHIALMNITPDRENPQDKETLIGIMDQLGVELRRNLRLGDIISRCSSTQFIIMLPKANYENSCMVCRRVLAAFKRTYPAADKQINFIVQPLTSRMRVP